MKILFKLFYMALILFTQACVTPEIPTEEENEGMTEEIVTPPLVTESVFPSWMATPVHFSQYQDAAPTAMVAPPFLGFSNDPDTHKKIYRLGGTGTEMMNKLYHPDGWTENQAQHSYSRVVPTNKSETYALGTTSSKLGASGLWKLHPTPTLVALAPAGDSKNGDVWGQRVQMWDKIQDNAYWYCDLNKLYKVTIDFSNYSVKKVLWDTFEGHSHVTLGDAEGDFSDDGSKLVLIGYKSGMGSAKSIIPYSVVSKIKHTAYSMASGDELDWASVDPKGEYIVISAIIGGQEKNVSVLFDKLSTGVFTTMYTDMKHSDFVIDKNNDSWLIYADWRGVFASRVKDGQMKKIWPEFHEFGKQGEMPPELEPHVTMSGHVSRVESLKGMVLIHRAYDGGMYFLNIDAPEYTSYAGNVHTGEGAPVGKNTRTLAQPWGYDDQGESTWYYRESRASASQTGKLIFYVSDYRVHGYKGYSPEPELKAFLNMLIMSN